MLADADMLDRVVLMGYPYEYGSTFGSVYKQVTETKLERHGRDLVRTCRMQKDEDSQVFDARVSPDGQQSSHVKVRTDFIASHTVAEPYNVGSWRNLALLRMTKKTYTGMVVESLTKDGPVMVKLGSEAQRRIKETGLIYAIQEAVENHILRSKPGASDQTILEEATRNYRKLQKMAGGTEGSGPMQLYSIKTNVPYVSGMTLKMLVDCDFLGAVDEVEWTYVDSPRTLTFLGGFQYRLEVLKPIRLDEVGNDLDYIHMIEPGATADDLLARSSHIDCATDGTGAKWMCLCRLKTKSFPRDSVMDRYIRAAKRYPELMPL